MTAAVFGLIGVVIGATITGGLNYALQARRTPRAEGRREANAGRALEHRRRDPLRAIKLKDRDFLEDATSENEWVRHHLQLARHLADDEWDAVAFAYGEGTVVRALLEGYPSDMWADEAERIVGLVDAGRDVLRARAESHGPRARRLEPS